jgi:hypothetical protein
MEYASGFEAGRKSLEKAGVSEESSWQGRLYILRAIKANSAIQ